MPASEQWRCSALALAIVVAACGGCPGVDPAPAPDALPLAEQAATPTVSLLVTGDTGKRHRSAASLLEGQLSVAAGMVVEDRRHAVDAVLLLGDNFYMEGLRRDELVSRIRDNVVLPYCHFLALEGPRSSEVRDACPVAKEERHVVPLYATLGNHDVVSPESAQLQATAIPEFVSNWSLDTIPGRLIEFPQGLSLIVLNTERMREALVQLPGLLREARGRFRVIAAHRPAWVDDQGGPLPLRGFRRDLRDAIASAGVRVHAFLAGHHHSLQLLALSNGEPSLAIIVGSGSRYSAIQHHHSDRVFGRGVLGFARLDLSGVGDAERLVVSLFAVPDLPVFATPPERVARWSVDSNGKARDELGKAMLQSVKAAPTDRE